MTKFEFWVHEDGTKEWYLNENLHRTGGPAVEEADGTKEWWIKGNLHREDGPAIEESGGAREFFLNGVYQTESDWKAKITIKYGENFLPKEK